MPIKLDPCNYTDQQFGSYAVICSREIEGRNICYFAGHSWFCEYPEYLFYYLEKIIAAGFEIIFVSSSEIGPVTLGRLQNTCAVIIQKENKGVDFGAWKIALELTGYGKDLHNILLANDSVMGPFFDLSLIIDKFRLSGSDFYGLTNSFQRNEHIQSYFILVNNHVAISDAWKDFWRDLQCYPTKDDIIDNYEIFFTKKLQSAGFHYGIWSDWKELSTTEALSRKIFKNEAFFTYWGPSLAALRDKFTRNINPCAFFWKELITQLHFPFLKRELVIYKKLNMEYDVLDNWKTPISNTGYDINYISQILSLGELTTIIRSFPFNSEKLGFHYYHGAGESHFSNFALIFGDKTLVDDGSPSHLKIKALSSGKELTFHFIYITEEAIDRFIEKKDAGRGLVPVTGKTTYNLVLPFSDGIIPYLQSLAYPQTAIFKKSDEYEPAMLRFIQQVFPDSGKLDNIHSPLAIRNVIDISDLKNVVTLSSSAAWVSQEGAVGEPETFFAVLNRYHREYETLPMWYKKIGQLFKIAMGHKVLRWEVRNKRISVVLKHKATVNEFNKVNFIKNWYHHEYDVLPGWYKKFGKLLNKNK